MLILSRIESSEDESWHLHVLMDVVTMIDIKYNVESEGE